MKIEIYRKELVLLLERQLSLFLINSDEMEKVNGFMEDVLMRVENCFKYNSNKYYNKNDEVYFNPFHSGQWAIFLYYYSNTIYIKAPHYRLICDKLYLLKKMLNRCHIFYQTNLPDIYMSDHPVVAVMGRGEYNDFFSFCQGYTVGNNNGLYPRFGKFVTMLSDSNVIGDCKIGDNVIIGANKYIKDQDVPSDSIVFGISSNLIFKPNNIGKLNFK